MFDTLCSSTIRALQWKVIVGFLLHAIYVATLEVIISGPKVISLMIGFNWVPQFDSSI